jgi:GNAT superfamily N-acetyltransferase
MKGTTMRSNTIQATPTLTLRRARIDDLPSVLTLLAEAAKWLNARGVRQWPVGGFPAARIEPLIGQGVMYVLNDGNDPVPAATVAVDDYADPEFWGPADRCDTALYVHKLAVSRAYSGQGLGDVLLDWAGRRALSEGRSWVRLDCSKDNARLQNFYRKLGFHHVRTVDLPHRASGALFERPAKWAGSDIALHDNTAHKALIEC